MKERYQFTHQNILAADYIKQNLQNTDVESAILRQPGYALKEWYFKSQNKCFIRYTINIKWTEPIGFVIQKNEVTVTEKRSVSLDSNPIQVKSEITTDVDFISATILHEFENRANDNMCIENRIIEVIYRGETYKDQIQQDFFHSILPIVCPERNAELSLPIAPNLSPSPSFGSISSNASLSTLGNAVPPQNFRIYHSMHDKLEQLKNAADSYAEIIGNSKLERRQLNLPSQYQISTVQEIADPSHFSIQDKISQFRSEADRTLAIVSGIKRSRQQISGSSSLPLFVLASCAAVVMLIVSRS